jgi:putative hemolysin
LNDILEALVETLLILKEESQLIERGDGTWLVDGHYSLTFFTYFDLDELINDDVTTVSGLIMSGTKTAQRHRTTFCHG